MISYTMTKGKGDTDLLLQRLAETLMARGHAPCGVVQINTECTANDSCDMDIRVLPDGPVFRISQDLGAGSRGCRLDPAALEAAVGHVSARLEDGADLLIVNKFGKQEADGRGFRDVIAQAIALDVPVLVGLNPANRPAFLEFAGDLAMELPPSGEALLDWVLQRVSCRDSVA